MPHWLPIIFQTNQNEQHGGQSIPAFDFYMAKGVLKSFRRHFRYRILSFLSLDYVDETNKEVKSFINENIHTILPDDATITETAEHFKIPGDQIKRLMEIAYDDTRLETYQAMEGFLHNLNTMHSRGGNQVVFSSINYGTEHFRRRKNGNKGTSEGYRRWTWKEGNTDISYPDF